MGCTASVRTQQEQPPPKPDIKRAIELHRQWISKLLLEVGGSREGQPKDALMQMKKKAKDYQHCEFGCWLEKAMNGTPVSTSHSVRVTHRKSPATGGTLGPPPKPSWKDVYAKHVAFHDAIAWVLTLAETDLPQARNLLRDGYLKDATEALVSLLVQLDS
ncbi:hypothetical protein Pelo_12089 [Pelomyxa schiedti]|nr:hypothetical protein Pelo_12089 [Pelomyxa schiedti]